MDKCTPRTLDAEHARGGGGGGAFKSTDRFGLLEAKVDRLQVRMSVRLASFDTIRACHKFCDILRLFPWMEGILHHTHSFASLVYGCRRQPPSVVVYSAHLSYNLIALSLPRGLLLCAVDFLWRSDVH